MLLLETSFVSISEILHPKQLVCLCVQVGATTKS